jgi:hypothetical protein
MTGASKAGAMAKLLTGVAALEALARSGTTKLMSLPEMLAGAAPHQTSGRDRKRKNYGLHQQSFKKGRPSKAVYLPHQGDREIARRLRRLAVA